MGIALRTLSPEINDFFTATVYRSPECGIISLAKRKFPYYGNSDVVVTLRLLKAIAKIASCTHHPRDRLTLEQQAEVILQGGHEGLSQQRDQKVVEEFYQQVAGTRRT